MKASELMIGDWVYDTILQGYTRVKVLTARGIKGDIHDNIWDEDSFAPIPLTPEILEKNGWRSRMNRTGEFYLKKPLVDAAIVTKTITGFQMNHGPFCRLSIHYVHELQHALRLCQIEKEIEL